MLKILLIVLIILTLFPPPIEKIRPNIRIIIGLTLIICILQKNEGFGNIDAEALQNMASLYNSSTGVLKVNNIEASGNITAAGYGEFGNAHIGTLKQATDWATVCHKNNKDKINHFSLIQNSAGHTVLNGAAGQAIEVKINDDINKGFMLDKDGNITANGNVAATGNVTATGYGEFGNAYIGRNLTTIQLPLTGQLFLIKIINQIKKYALVQNPEGKTIVNSATGQPVEIRTDDDWENPVSLKDASLTAHDLTLNSGCSSNGGPIRLTNSSCNHDKHKDNLAIGGQAHMEVWVDS